MNCKHCGATIPENSKFCLTCGKEVFEGPSTTMASSPFMRAGSLDGSEPNKPIRTEAKEQESESNLRFSPGFSRSENAHVEVKEKKPNPSPNPKGVFCGYCGAKNRDDSAFCEECGASLEKSATAAPCSNQAKEKPKARKRNRIVGISIVVAIVVAFLAIAVGIFGGRSYKSTADKFIKAAFEADGEVMLSIMPEEIIKAICEKEGVTERELAKELTQFLKEEFVDYSSYFDEWSYSYEIIEVKDISEEDLKDIKENYKDFIDIKIKAAKMVMVEVTITLDGDSMQQHGVSIPMIKVGNSWYLDASTLD